MFANDTAFPVDASQAMYNTRGLSARLYIASQVMAGFAANPEFDFTDVEGQAQLALKWAETLLRRDRETP